MARRKPADDEEDLPIDPPPPRPSATQVFVGTAPPPTPRATAPLFPAIGKGPSTPDRVKVTRLDPPDGYLGIIDASADEETIAQRWGGRVYELVAINAAGQMVPNGKRSITINQLPRVAPGPPPPVAPVQPQYAAADIASIYERQIAAVKAESEASEAKARRELEAYVARSKADTEAMLAAERQRHTQSMEAERQRLEASSKDSREFMANMIKMQGDASAQTTQIVVAALNSSKGTDNTTAMLTVMRESMQLMAGIGQEDPSVAMAKALTSGLGSFAQLAAGDPARQQQPPQRTIIQQNGPARPNRGPGLQQPRQPQQQAPRAAQQPAQPTAPVTADQIDPQAIQAKAQVLFQRLIAEGGNPEAIIDGILSGEIRLARAEDLEDDFEEDDDPNQESHPQRAGAPPPGQDRPRADSAGDRGPDRGSPAAAHVATD